MKTIVTVLTLTVFFSMYSYGQSLHSLKLSVKEIPGDYSISKNTNCNGVQECIFYENPRMYEMLIGKIRKKEIQNFESKNDNGSIMYFEFYDELKRD